MSTSTPRTWASLVATGAGGVISASATGRSWNGLAFLLLLLLLGVVRICLVDVLLVGVRVVDAAADGIGGCRWHASCGC